MSTHTSGTASPGAGATASDREGLVDGRKFRVVVADERLQRDERVLGANHVRRSPKDIAAEQAHRQRVQPRWQRTLHYRIRRSGRIRLLCILLPCIAGAATGLGFFWHLGEEMAGIAVSIVILFAGISLFVSTEIMIRCPHLTKGLLRDLGIIHPVRVETRGGWGHHSSDSEGDLEEGGAMSPEAYADAVYGAVDDDREYYAVHPSAASRKPRWGDVAPYVNTAPERLRRMGDSLLAAVGGARNPMEIMLQGNPFAARDEDELAAMSPEDRHYYEEQLGALEDQARLDALEAEGHSPHDYGEAAEDGQYYYYDYGDDDGGAYRSGGGEEEGAPRYAEEEEEEEEDDSAQDAPLVADPSAAEPTPPRARRDSGSSSAEDSHDTGEDRGFVPSSVVDGDRHLD